MPKLLQFSPGDTFGKLTFMEPVANSSPPRSWFLCECGKRVKRRNSYITYAVKKGVQVSCGCTVGNLSNKSPEWAVKRNEKLIAMRKSGAGLVLLSEHFGLSRERVCQILRPHGISNTRKKVYVNDIKPLVSQGMSASKIAGQLGVGVAKIKNTINRSADLQKLYDGLENKRKQLQKQELDNTFDAKWLGGNWKKIRDEIPSCRLTYVKRIIGRQCLFKCDCGEDKIICLDFVTKGRTKSCGCLNREYRESVSAGVHWDTGKGKITTKAGAQWSAKNTKKSKQREALRQPLPVS